MRRWTATYHAPNFLMPPLELMGLAAIVREWKQGEARVVDCVALDQSLPDLLSESERFSPDVIVVAVGFGTFPEDLAAADALAEAHPQAIVALTGYLVSSHPLDVLAHSRAQVVLTDEPETTFSELWDRLEARASLAGLPGAAVRDAAGARVGAPRPRLDDLDRLPFPDHSLVDLSLYGEPMRPGPMGATVSSRGCPHACTFCTRTYGRLVRYRSPESVLAEARSLVLRLGIRSLRFMDDTLPLDRARLMRICTLLERERLGLTWTALSRLDTLDPELLDAMVHSGCRRLYIGFESTSQLVLDRIRKGYSATEMERRVRDVKRAGLEVSGFFIVGTPWETDDDVDRSIQAAIDWNLDYVIVTRLQFWPGTQLGSESPGVSLFPFRPASAPDRTLELEQRFYRRFYLRPGYVAHRMTRLLARPLDALAGLRSLGTYLTTRPERDLI